MSKGRPGLRMGELVLARPGEFKAKRAAEHPGWAALSAQLARVRSGYSGGSPQGASITLWVEPGTPLELTREALRTVAAAFPDEAYRAPKLPPLTVLTAIPKE